MLSSVAVSPATRTASIVSRLLPLVEVASGGMHGSMATRGQADGAGSVAIDELRAAYVALLESAIAAASKGERQIDARPLRGDPKRRHSHRTRCRKRWLACDPRQPMLSLGGHGATATAKDVAKRTQADAERSDHA